MFRLLAWYCYWRTWVWRQNVKLAYDAAGPYQKYLIMGDDYGNNCSGLAHYQYHVRDILHSEIKRKKWKARCAYFAELDQYR